MANQDFRVKNGLQVGLGASVVGIVTAESFSGSGVGLTSVPSSSLTGTISTERLSGTYNIDITGTVSGDSINVGTGNTGVFANSDGTLLVTGIATFKDRVIFDSTNSIQVPVGTEAEKDAVGTAVTGQIRYNTTNSQFEGFGPGNDWGSLGGVKDVDGDTYVKPESSPGSDEDALTFFTGGTERAVIDSTGKVGIGSTQPTSTLDLDGTLNVSGVSTFGGAVRINSGISQESIAVFNVDGSVELYYDNSKKFETTTDGFKVLNGTSETAVISGPQNIILDPSPDDVVAIVEGDISAAGVSTITGITTTNIAVGNLIQEVDGVISTGTTVTSVGASQVGISKTSLGSATNQEFVFVNQTPTGIVRVKGDLYIDGTRTEINSTTLTVDDLNVVVASGATNGLIADGAGLTVDGANAYLKYNYNAGTNENWEINKNLNIGTAATSTDLPGLYLKGLSDETNTIQNPSISIGGTTTSKYYDIYVVDDPNVQYVRHYSNGFDINMSVDDARQFVVSNTNGFNSLLDPGVLDNEIAFKIIPESSTELRYNKVKKFETTGYGVTVTGALGVSGVSTFNDKVAIGTNLVSNSGKLHFPTADGYLGRASISVGNPLIDYGLYVVDSTSNANSNLHQNYVRQTTSGNYSISVGATEAFRVSNNDGSSSHTANPGGMQDTDVAFIVNPDTSTELRYNYDKKLETTGYGVSVTDGLNVSGVSTFQNNVSIAGTTTGLYFDAPASASGIFSNPRIQIDTPTIGRYYSVLAVDATPVQYIRHLAADLDFNISVSNDRTFLISGGESASQALNSLGVQDSDIAFKIVPESSTELRFNKEKRFETTGYGVSVTGGLNVSGIATAQKFIGDGSQLRGLRSTELVSYASASDISNSALSISGISNYNEVGILTGTYATDSGDRFGWDVACSADGNTIIVSADTDETGSTNSTGVVYVYDRVGNTFNEVGILTGSYTDDPADTFGYRVATSADGKTIVVSDLGEELGGSEGVVYVFDRVENNFNQVGILTGSLAASNNNSNGFGFDVACSADGKTIIVGDATEDFGSINSPGVVYVYDRVGNNFNEVGILTGSNSSSSSFFGFSVATSADGKTIAVGAANDDTNGLLAGSTYVFDRVGNNFNEVGILTGTYASAMGDFFGNSVTCSADGKTIVVGARDDEVPGSSNSSGIVYVYDRVGNNFNQVGILTGTYASDNQDRFGQSVATSADGKTIVVGAWEDEVPGSSGGVVYTFNRQGNNFNQVGILTGSASSGSSQFGKEIATSADGKTIIVGAHNTGTGAAYVFDQERETYVFSDANGNIGIGSAQPTAKLDVNGGLNVSGISSFNDDTYFHGTLGQELFWDQSENILDFAVNASAGFGNSNQLKVSGGVNGGTIELSGTSPTSGLFIKKGTTESIANFIVDGAVDLYYDNSKKFETTDDGVTITGIATAQLFSGNGSSLTNVSAFEAYKSDISDRAFKTDEISGALAYAYNGQRVNSPSNHTFALKTVISKNGKVAFVSEYDDQSNQLDTGRIHIYERTGANFTAIGIVTQTSHSSPGVAETTTCFGPIVACNADASIFAVGSPQGNPNTSDYFSFWHSPIGPGQQSVHIFQRDGSTITNIGILTSPSLGPNSNGNDSFGGALAFNDDGSKLYVGSPNREENGPIDGAVFVYDKSGLTYNYVGIITHSLQFGSLFNGFGQELACSSDGNILFVGWPCAYRPDNPAGGGLTLSGVIEIYDRSGSTFNNVGIISAGHRSNGNPQGRGFGYEIACSDDGNYVYTTSFQMGNGAEDYNWGKLHLFKRESNTYSEVSSSILETPVNNNNRLQWGLACDSSGSKVIAGESNVVAAGYGVTGYVHYYARVGDIITNIGYFGSNLSSVYGYGTFGLDLDLDGSGEVGIIAAPYNAYSGDNAAVINGNAFFVEQTRGTSVYSDIATGNIGIKTDSPKATLDVNGSIKQELHTPTMPVGLIDDIGENWYDIGPNTGLDVLDKINAIVYCGEGIVLAGAGGYHGDVFRSTDYGKTWIRRETGIGDIEADITALVYCGNGIALAGNRYNNAGDGDIYRSTDFGLTWTKIYDSTTLEEILSLEYCGNGIVLAGTGDSTDNGDVYRSTDFGLNWTKVEMGSDLERIHSLCYIGNGIVLAGSGSNTGDGDVYRSTDFGQNWTKIEMGADLERILSFAYCGGGVVVAGAGNSTDDGDVYRSTDFGQNWTKIEMGSSFEEVLSLAYCDNGIVLAGTGSGTGDAFVYKSVDYGQTWTQVVVDQYGSSQTIESLCYLGNGTVLAGGGDTMLRGDVWRSDVGFSQGSTAQSIHHQNTTGNIGIGSIDPVVKLDVAGFIKQELHTPAMPIGLNDDIAKVWTKVEVGTGLQQIPTLVYCGDGIVLAGSGSTDTADDGDIYRSTDFGRTWIQIEMGSGLESILSLEYCGDGIVLAGAGSNTGDGDVYRSTDFGLNWTKVEMGAGLEQIPALAYCGDGIVLAGAGSSTGDGDVYRSTDYGQTWTKTYDSTSLEIIYSITYCGDGLVLAGTGSDTQDGDILRSTDYGQTWTKNNMFTSDYLEAIHTILYCGSGIVLAGAGFDTDGIRGNGVVFKSKNYGKTWVRKIPQVDGSSNTDLESIHSLIYCDNGIVLAGAGSSTGDGDILKSTDLGENWTKVEMGSGLESVLSLVYCGNGIVLAGSGSSTGDGDIYRSDVGFSPASTIQGIHHEHLTGNIGIGSTQPTAQLNIYKPTTTTGVTTNLKVQDGNVYWAVEFEGNASNNTRVPYITGNKGLYFSSDGDFNFSNYAGTENYLQWDAAAGQLDLLYGNSSQGHTNAIRLSTKSYGIDVSGDINVGAAVSLRAAYSGGTYPSDRLYITSKDPSRPGSIAIGKQGDWAGQNLSDIDIVMSAHNTAFNFANIAICGINSNATFLEISSVQETSGSLREYSEIIQKKGDLTLLAEESDSSIIFGTGNSGAQVIDTNDKPLVKLNVNPSSPVDPNIVLGGEMTLTPVGGGVTIGGNVNVTGIATAQKFVGDGSELTNLPPAGSDLVSYASASDISNSALSISGISTHNQVGILTGSLASDSYDYFGYSVATSADGKNIVVGAWGDKIGISSGSSGVVYVFDREGNTFNEVGILTGTYASHVVDGFGYSVATSADGKNIVVGCLGDAVPGSGASSGVVYVFDREGNTFNEVGILTGTYASDSGDVFGRSVATSADGKTIVVGAWGDEVPGSGGDSGVVYVFDRVGNNFNEVGILTGTYATDSNDYFGQSVATSADGKTIVVGARQDEVPGYLSGVTYVFDREGNNFNQVGILTGSLETSSSLVNFGNSVTTSADGKTIVVGAPQDSDDGSFSGVVYVFDREGNNFNQVGILTGTYASDSNDSFGQSVATSADGNTIVVGAHYDEVPGSSNSSGVTYVFNRQGNTFNEVGILTGTYASGSNDEFGYSVATSADGKNIVVGAYNNEIPGSGSQSGVVYVFDQERETYVFSDANGNIGIGYSQPTAKLDVNGGLNVSGVSTFAGVTVTGGLNVGTHSIVSITTSHTASAGTPFTIDTFATSENDLAEYTIHVGYGNTIQAQKVLVMHDGTTAYSQEYAVMYNPSKIVTIEASISGSNVLLQATPETGISGITTYKIVRGGLV